MSDEDHIKKIHRFFFIEKCDLTYVHEVIKSSTSIQGMAPFLASI